MGVLARKSGLASLLLVLCFFVFIEGCGVNDNSTTKQSSAGSNGNVYTSDAYKAFAISKRFAKSKLKSPSTAEFPIYSEYSEGIHVVDKDDSFFVASYVDSQNSFGAMIRTKYLCSVNKGTWEVDEFTFDTE